MPRSLCRQSFSSRSGTRPIWAESVFFPGGTRKILALADEEAAAHFRSGTWMAAAIAHFGIEVRVVPLADELRARIRGAQQRQRR